MTFNTICDAHAEQSAVHLVRRGGEEINRHQLFLHIVVALARELLGARRSSVLAIPPRAVVSLQDYDETNALCRRLTDQGLSKQAFSLRARILEVDRVLGEVSLLAAGADRAPLVEKPRGHPARVQAERLESRESLRRFARIIEPDGGAAERNDRGRLPAGRVVEMHPELSFRELAGAPPAHAKKTPEGAAERRALLASAGIHLPAEVEQIGGVALDDLLDAAAIAWSAQRYAELRARSIPPRELAARG